MYINRNKNKKLFAFNAKAKLSFYIFLHNKSNAMLLNSKVGIIISMLIFFSLKNFNNSFAQEVLNLSYTGSVYSFTVPFCVDTIHVKLWGAGGSGGGNDSYQGAVGGGGSYIKSDIAVTPGQIITIVIGGGAGPGAQCSGCAPGGTSGWGNGLVAGGSGGNAGCSGCSGGGGGGGGGSALYVGASPILVAGGGGGGSGGGQFSSGAVGGGGGENGNVSPGSCSSPGITGASANGNGNSGTNKGGDGGGGGGGGGGYFGATGGGVAGGCDCGACGGGGGSSFSSGNNIIIINGNGQAAGNNTDPILPPGAANGGNGSTKGGDGFVQLIFNGSPNAAFSNTTVCYGTATDFINNTTNNTGTIISRSWDFGDGSPIETSINPSHTFASGGMYNVKLIENNSVGCSDTIIKAVQVYFNPVANFTYTDVCFGDSVNFTNTSIIDFSTTIALYLWTAGDGGATSSVQNLTHYYPAGTYPVLLLATSADGCSDTASAIINTFDAPQSVFSISSGCLIDSAKFTNTSINPVMGNIASWSINFGDGSPINTSVWSPKHKYTIAGNYQVTLITFSSNLGCPDTAQNTITIFPMPVANFDFIDVCHHQTMNFFDSSTVSSGNIADRLWSFGDGSPLSVMQNPTHLYTNVGTYAVSLIVTSNNTCKDTITQNVVVHPLPLVNYTSTNVCDDSIVKFSNLSTIPASDTIQFWTWDFGDASINSINENTSHLYAAPGSYNVQLVVVSTFGCSDSIIKISIVNPNPSISFFGNDTIGCELLCISFQDFSSILTGSNTQWLWDFGDGSAPLNGQQVIHCYKNDSVFLPNIFNVTATVTSDSACVSIITKINYITVNPNPIASFIVNPTTTTIIDPIISFTDFSIGSDIWNWNFGDQDSSNLNNPAPHIYADTGIYIIRLISSTNLGCSDTAYQTIVIEPEFVFYIPNAFSPDGDGINDSFIGKGIFIKKYDMTILDRWGDVIFYTDNVNMPWDGKANNGINIALQDVYVYVIKVLDFKDNKHQYRGKVTLLR